jgi:hypothetical protein
VRRRPLDADCPLRQSDEEDDIDEQDDEQRTPCARRRASLGFSLIGSRAAHWSGMPVEP